MNPSCCDAQSHDNVPSEFAEKFCRFHELNVPRRHTYGASPGRLLYWRKTRFLYPCLFTLLNWVVDIGHTLGAGPQEWPGVRVPSFPDSTGEVVAAISLEDIRKFYL